MKPQYKFIMKIWMIAFGLSISTAYAIDLTDSQELVLLLRLAGTAFFIILYRYVSNMINKQNEIIKASNGFAKLLFDPNYLKITLLLCIIGWTTFSMMEYLKINQIDWLMTFIILVVVLPFATGKIPLYIKREKWRK